MKFILASQSPIRKKILSNLGYKFTCIPSFSEEYFDKKSIEDNAMRLSLEKALSVQKKYKEDIIIGSDSIMQNPNGVFLEKPKDRDDARTMMQNRSGEKEIIVSGIAIVHNDKFFQGYEKTTLYWKKCSSQEIEKILNTEEWKGKCGGIMVEGIAGLFLEKIEGSLVNIMGFPLSQFWSGLKELNINRD